MQDIYVNDIKVDTVADSVTISEAIEQRSVCTFTVLDLENNYVFLKGMPVKINNNLEWSNAYQSWSQADFLWTSDDTYFNGWIDKAIKRKEYNGIYYHYITCVDSHYLADKRIIAESYVDMHAGDIVTDIFTNYLQSEGVQIGTIELGSIAIEAVFNYIPITEALDKLCEKSGFYWNIDHDKKLNFKSKSGNLSVYNINYSDIIIVKDTLKVEQSNALYRNKQYVKGSKDVTDDQTEIKKGDGENNAFTVGYPIAEEPYIEIDVGSGYIAQSVGIKGVDTAKNWYWVKGSNVIVQEDSDTILGINDKLKITYKGEFDVVVVTFDSQKIEERKEIEKIGTGIIENVFEDQSLTGRESAFDIANAKLKKYSEITKTINFVTTEKSFKVGQISNVTINDHNIFNEEFLITRINIFTENRGLDIYYEIEAVKGQDNDAWTKYFINLQRQTEKFVVRENISENQILATLEEFTKNWYNIESPNIFKTTIAGNNTFPTINTLPMFANSDKVKYVAWYVSGVESGRKQVAKKIDSENQIFTLSYLSPIDANVNISHIGWFGGVDASNENNTGIEIDKQTYVKNKTELESVQIEKTDINIDSIIGIGTQLTPLFLNNREQSIYLMRNYAEQEIGILLASI